MKKKIGLLICLSVILIGSLFHVDAVEDTNMLSDYEMNMLHEYDKGNLNNDDFVQVRKEKAIKNNLLDFVDENYFLTEDFYYEYSDTYLMNDGLVILDRYSAHLTNEENYMMTRSAYSVIDHSVHRFDNANGGYITNGLWRLSNNNLAFCAQGLMSSPAIGDSTSAPYQVDNDSLIKALYYSYGGPGDILTSRYGQSGAIVLTDELVSNAYSGTCISKANNNGYHWNNVVGNLWNEIMSKSLPKNYVAYMVDVDGTAINWQGVVANKQKLVYGAYEPKGSLKLKKSSSLPNISSNNQLYSLEGTKYGLFDDESCTSYIDTFVLDENGESNTIENLKVKTYYVKETNVSNSYVKDETVYKIDVKEDSCQTINVTDIPKTNNLDLVLMKTDSETGEKAQGQGTFENAEFVFKYYDGYYDKIENQLKPLKQWIMKTDVNGKIYFDSDHKVSGDDFYYDKDGKVVFPLGTVTAQEVKPCSGYTLNNTVFLQKLTTSLNTEHFYAFKTFSVANDVIRLKLKKVQTGTDIPLSGVMFSHTSPDGVVKKMRSNSNGEFTLTGIQVGKHKIQELKTVSGYVYSDKVYEFEIKQDGSIVMDNNLKVIENDVQPYCLKIVKKSTSSTLLDGAKFGLYSDKECKNLIEENISNNGIIEFKNLENAKHYYFKEIKAPKGYELDETVHEIYTDMIPVSGQYDVYIDQVKYTDKIDDFTITYECTNKKTTKLPHTGSSMHLILIALGLGCICFGRKLNEK